MAQPLISVQLYSVRTQLEADFDGTIGRLADLGITRVEPFLFTVDTEKHAESYQRHGMTAPSGHEELLGRDQDRIFDAANRLGIPIVIDNFLNPTGWSSEADIVEIADKLNIAADRARAHGIRVGYHNHEWEVRFEIDGRSGLEILASHLDPDVLLEVDTYWAAVGGADVPDLLARLGSRVELAHLKDGPIHAEKTGQTVLGQGRMPIEDIVRRSEHLRLGVIEFDEFDGDVVEAVGLSSDYLASIGGRR